VSLSQESAKRLGQDDPCARQSDANGESDRFVLSGRFGRRSGLGLEYVTSGGVGLFLNLSADAHNDESDNWRLATRRLHSDWSIEHMIDVGFAVHLWPDSSWDPYLSAALSHLGYVVSTLGNDDEIVGGSLFPKLAVGLRWKWRYLHIGVEFGWYPYEAFRYDINRRPDTVVVYDLTDQERWSARRFSTSWLVGLQF
jgi:hypothetical protein